MTPEDVARLAAHGIHFTEASPELTEDQERIVEARIEANRAYRATRWHPGQKDQVDALMDRLAGGEVTMEQLQIGPTTTFGELIERLKGDTDK